MTNPAHPAATIIDLYQRHGPAWAKDRGDTLIESAWLDRFLALAAPSPTILDLGCGAGRPIARALTERGGQVTGIDSAPAMIALARASFPAGDWRVADMRALALNQTFGAIIAWDSFFHLTPEDQRAMFPIFHAHAAAGAPLMFTAGPAHGEAIGALRGEPLYHASLDPAEYRALFAANGFTEIAHTVEDPACGRRTIFLAQAAPA